MILKKVKPVGIYPEPGGGYIYDLKIEDTLDFGDDSWINTTNLHAGWYRDQYMSILSAPDNDKGAGLFAVRTANAKPGWMHSGFDFILRQDMPASIGRCWGYGIYGEVYKEAFAHKESNAHGVEIAAINRHPYVARVTPNNPNPNGMVELFRLMAEELGVDDDPDNHKPGYDSSVAFTIGHGNGGKRFITGINVSAGTIHPDGEVMALPEGVPIAWFAPDGKRTTLTVVNGMPVWRSVEAKSNSIGAIMRSVAAGAVMLLASIFAAPVFAGSTVTVLGNTGNLSRDGYTFAGWNTAVNGGGITYQPGATFEIGNADVSLYAQWTAIPVIVGYRVTYHANGATSGTVPVDANTYTPGAPPPAGACGPGETFGPNDIVNPMAIGYIWPQPAAAISGAAGVAVRFVADAAQYASGLILQVFDEGGNPAKEAVVSTCPHNFTPVNNNAVCRRGSVTAKADFYLRFGAAQAAIDCALVPGQTYYLNVRASDMGETRTQFYNIGR